MKNSNINIIIISILLFASMVKGGNVTLFSPFIPYPEEDITFHTYIISNDGIVQHIWDHDCSIASTPYLIDNNILIRPCEVEFPIIDLPGTGGRIQMINWIGEIIWDFIYSSDTIQQHHDIEILPNGNILILAWEKISQEAALAAGKLNQTGVLYVDMIVEIEPVGVDSGNIVWEWHFWDHLIQDTIPGLDNYGIISDHPELLDINYAGSTGEGPGPPDLENPDFTHCNAIHYNYELDQILITSRRANEIYIIDHTTTTAEASSHEGGTYGKGGDILYRWGNPKNYHRGNIEDQVLFAPHGANWIQTGYLGEGNILIYNNGVNDPINDYSSIIEINTPMDLDGFYNIESDAPFYPINPVWTYTDSIFSSQFQSGAFRLENGNTLVSVSEENYIFEVTQEGIIDWYYVYTGNGYIARAVGYEMEILKADINRDGSIDILDLLIIIYQILETGDSSISIMNIDFNNDEVIDIFDIIIFIDLLIDGL